MDNLSTKPLALWFLLLFGLLNTAMAQPVPHAKESLLSGSETFEVAVPVDAELNGGHLQGVQHRNGTVIVSGSSAQFGYLALFQKMGNGFRFVGTKKLARSPFDHAGGFQLADNWLAIGIEDPASRRESVIQLIDVSSFETFSAPPVFSLKRTGEPKLSTSGAVALIKRTNHFLLAVGSWDCTTIDFYVSNGTDPYAADFTFEKWTNWDSREAIRKDWIDKELGSYQNLQFTEDTTGLYLTGFCRTGSGADRADAFLVKPDSDPYHLLSKTASYTVQCSDGVTFRNGAGFTMYNGRPSIISVGRNLSPATKFQVSPMVR